VKPARHHIRRRLLIIGGCLLIALVAATASVSTIGLLPPSITPRDIEIGGAATRIAVDRSRPLISDSAATGYDYETLNKRTSLLANLMASKPVMTYIAREAGLRPSDISAATRTTRLVQRVFLEPDSERRADRIAGQSKRYRLELRPSQALPTIEVFAQAPSVAEATRLADAVVSGMRGYLAELGREQQGGPRKQLQLEQLGAARGAVVNSGVRSQIFALTFVLALALSLVLAIVTSRWILGRLGSSTTERPAPAPPSATVGLARPRDSAALSGRATRAAGDWPRTTRMLPWMVAAFVAVVWLVPFNDIQLTVNLPIDLKFDRIVLPILVATWLLVLATGRRNAPRSRLTWIHVAIGAFVTLAFFSVVLEARTLNQTLEFDLAIKRLALLAAYAMLFLVTATVVRRSEVRAFMTYTLVLAVIVAVGMVIEYRAAFNVFYWLSERILPGIFEIASADSSGVDDIGRRFIRGPTQHALEAVAVLAMALPIALTRVLQADRLRERVLYGLAAALLFAAMLTTLRKSAFIAPLSVGATLAYYRRRELIKLAPLGVVVALVIPVVSPSALSQVVVSLDRSKLGVSTVSDRTADYDAIRPDVWTHLAFGRGYGSYEPSTYRIIDMELLLRLLEGGIVGLIAYVLMMLSVVAVARGPIRARRPDDAPVALAVASAAVCMLVVSTLFDVLAFPHVPYVFFWMAALLAVTTGARPQSADPALPALDVASPAKRPAGVREPAWSS